MNDIQSYEKLIKQKTEGKLLFKRIAFICLYALLSIVGIPLAIIYLDGNVSVILLLVAITVGFIFFSWKLTSIEYEYSIYPGTFTLSKIYGKSRRKEIFESDLHNAAIIAPYNEKYSEKAEKCAPNDIFYAVSSKKAPNTWFAVFEETGGIKTLVFFEADERSLSTFRHYCPRATVREKLSND